MGTGNGLRRFICPGQETKRGEGVRGEGVRGNCMHWQVEGRKEMFYLTTHSTHFIYGYMASDIWLRTILIVREETRCRHIGYSFQLAARVLLYAPSHRQDSTYHCLCYTSHGALAGTWQVEGSTSSPTGISSSRGICTGWVFTVQITVAMHIPQQNSFTIMQLLRIYIYMKGS